MFQALRNLHLFVTQRASWKLEQDIVLESVFDTTIGNNSVHEHINQINPKSMKFLPIYVEKTRTNNISISVEVVLLNTKSQSTKEY